MEERESLTQGWLAAKPTFLENLTSELLELSMPHIAVPLSADERDALAAGEFKCLKEYEVVYQKLRLKVASAMGCFPRGAFVRMGSRSPKDVLCAAGSYRMISVDQAMLMLLRSRRVRNDCESARAQGYLPYIFVREWRNIPPWSEMRVFVENRKLAGICPYHARVAPERPPAISAAMMVDAVSALLPLLLERVHLASVVIDVYVEPQDMPQAPLAATLIEINPFCSRTDGVMFSWNIPGDFDGSFRDYIV